MKRMATSRRWNGQPRRITFYDVAAIVIFTAAAVGAIVFFCALTWLVA